MSYRGRKPFHQGPGKRAERDNVPASFGPSPMITPTIDTGPVNSLGFSIPIPSSRQADIKEGLGDITSRLNRALSQYANVFSDDDDEGETKDVSRTGVEDEKREFQARYETITARVDAMERERTELMSSMAEWLEADQVQLFTEVRRGSDIVDEPGEVLRDELLNTKMGFEKLKQMNHEKERLDSQGKDTGLLQVESSKLQMKVIEKFKMLHEKNKLAATRRTFGAHWKHASDEIVGLLRRIRSEGTSDIESLEDELEKAMNGIQRQAEEMMRLEGQIREKEEMVEKWSAENAKLTNDNLLLNSEKEKCRDIIRKLKKALIEERRKKGTPTTVEDVEDISEGKRIQKTMPGIPQREEQLRRPTRKIPAGRDVSEDRVLCKICRRQVDSGVAAEADPPEQATARLAGSAEGAWERDDRCEEGTVADVIVLKEENDWLTAKVARLEQTLIQKETQMMKLEMQLSEIMEAVKTSSPQIIPTLSLTDPVTLRLAGTAEENPAPKTNEKRAVGRPAMDTTPVARPKPTPSQKLSNLAVPHVTKKTPQKSAKRRGGDQQPINKQPSQSSLERSAEVSQLTEQRDKLQGELVAIKGQLMRAQRELITLKYASSGPATGAGGGKRQVDGSRQGTVDEDVEGSDGGMSSTRTSATQETPAKPQAIVYDDEFQAYAELMRQDQESRPQRQRRMSRPCQQPKNDGGRKEGPVTASLGDHTGGEQVEGVEHLEDFVTFDQGMQTDPQMDPLGQWSNVPSLKKRRRTADPLPLLSTRSATDTPPDQAQLPQPPTEWTHFDPTGPITPATSTKPGTISQQMRAGQEPAMLDAEDIVVYVDRELGRIIQGINGFTSYLKRLIQREVTDMITTNQDIRKHLSEATLRKLDQGGKDSTHPPTDDGRRSRVLATPIRRGRFEIIKDNKPSKFASKNAYASLQSGGRRFFHSASPLPQWNIHSKTPTPTAHDHACGWSTFARDHITMADEAAIERCIPSQRGTIRSRLQHQIEMIGQHAIDVLRGTTVFFKETVTRQMEEYSTLHGAFGIRQELKALMAPSSPRNDNKGAPATIDTEKGEHGSEINGDGVHVQLPHRELPLKLSRSTSHNSFLESRNINYIQGKKHIDFDFTVKPKDGPVETQSLSSIQSSHCYLPALTVYESQKPRNRCEMQVPKATLPRRGLVTLQVKAATVTIGPSTKGVDSKRRSRPVAVSHRGLLARQRDILTRHGTKPEDAHEQQQEEELTTISELRRHLFQLPAEQLYQASEQSAVPTGEHDADTNRSLPPLENERRSVMIHAQD